MYIQNLIFFLYNKKVRRKNLVIKDRKTAENFISALENAVNKKSKKVSIDKRVEDVTDEEQIRKIFDK